jgi:hypothetical protein
MRYLIIKYYKKPNGQIDEAMTVSRNLRIRDQQEASVIIDFRDLKVLKASMGDATVPKNFDRIVTYYRQYYKNIIDRLFQENGYQVDEPKAPDTDNTATAAPVEATAAETEPITS